MKQEQTRVRLMILDVHRNLLQFVKKGRSRGRVCVCGGGGGGGGGEGGGCSHT